MLISLFKTSFDHFQFRPTSGMTSIHDLTLCLSQIGSYTTFSIFSGGFYCSFPWGTRKNIYFEIRVRLTPSTLGLKISHFCPKTGTGRKSPAWFIWCFLNFYCMLRHYHPLGRVPDHSGTIQTSTRHPQTPRNLPPFLVKNGPLGHWEKMQYIEIKIPTQLFFQLF